LLVLYAARSQVGRDERAWPVVGPSALPFERSFQVGVMTAVCGGVAAAPPL
jgi:hypothetical protein